MCEISAFKAANKVPMAIIVSEKLDAQLRCELNELFKKEVPSTGVFQFMGLFVFKIPHPDQEFVGVVEKIPE